MTQTSMARFLLLGGSACVYCGRKEGRCALFRITARANYSRLGRLSRGVPTGAHLPAVFQQPLLHGLELGNGLGSLEVFAVRRTVLFSGHHSSPSFSGSANLASELTASRKRSCHGLYLQK